MKNVFIKDYAASSITIILYITYSLDSSNIDKNIRKALDDGNIGCGVFVELQKAFDTVYHQILLLELNQYGIQGFLNDSFKSYLSNRNQYISINDY